MRPTKEQLEGLSRELARALQRRLPDPIRFVIILADEGPDGSVAYAASMDRESAAGCFMELVEAWGVEIEGAS